MIFDQNIFILSQGMILDQNICVASKAMIFDQDICVVSKVMIFEGGQDLIIWIQSVIYWVISAYHNHYSVCKILGSYRISQKSVLNNF